MLCPKACNFGVIEKDGDKVKFDLDKCVLCGSCEEVCPVDAIHIERKKIDTEEIAQYKNVFVFCETHEGRLRSVALELVTKGRELADKLGEKLVAILIGNDIEKHAQTLIHHGADHVLVVEGKIFTDYTTDAYTIAMTSIIAPRKPAIVLYGATSNGRDLAPRIAARLSLGLTADCTGLEIDEARQLVQTRPAFGGNIMAEIISPYTRPQMATVRPNVFKPGEPDTSRKGEIEKVNIEVSPVQVRTRVTEKVNEIVEGMKSVEEADIIVCSGRGIKDPANLELPRQLAKLVQHLVGMSSSDLIIAINKDPDAPIFSIADFGIVGDIFTVLPELIAEVKRVLDSR
jgi:electron transfer flavoprotein alpha subunit